MRFEWDPAKDHANQDNHGVSFQEASELFTTGVDVLEVYDETHSIDEDRFIGVGPTRRGVIVIVYTEPHEDVIRIVSARMATRRERERFDAFWRDKRG
jgi:uncharacterized DUF497 family protein